MCDETPDAEAKADAEAEARSLIDDAVQAREDLRAAARELANQERDWYGAQTARLAVYTDLLRQLCGNTADGETPVELNYHVERARDAALRAVFRDIARLARGARGVRL